MKKKMFFAGMMAAATILFCGTGYAGNVKGNIQCTSGASAEGAAVYLAGDSFISITDEAGDFLLRNMPAGTYDLKVKVGDKGTATIGNVKVKPSKATNLGTVMVNCEGPCFTNTDCPSGEFCKKQTADCGDSGVCQARPQNCLAMFNPVCGCDGHDYSNSCYAAMAGMNVAHTGLCSR